MDKYYKIKTLVSSVVLMSSLAMTGCGGGSDSAAKTPNGIYLGSITGGDVSYNGDEEKAIIYGNRMMVLSYINGGVSQIFDAALTDASKSLAGTGVRYSPQPLKLNDLIFDGTYVSGTSAAVNFVETTSGAVTLPPGLISLSANSSLYAKGAVLSRLSGIWSGIYASGPSKVMTLEINANGTIVSGVSSIDSNGSSCGFSGMFGVVDAVLNVYSLSLTSDGGTAPIICDLGAGTFTGFAWTEGDTDGTLVLLAADGNKARAVVLTKN